MTSDAGAPPAGADAYLAAGLDPPETPEQKYMRHMRNAIVFIAVVVGVSFVLGFVVAIVTGVQMGSIDSRLGNLTGNATSSNCVSQGGSDPSC